MQAALRARSTRGRRRIPKACYRAAIRAKALDTLRGMLPAATQSNVGLFGTGPGLRGAAAAHARASARGGARPARDQMLAELRKVIPAFLDARRSAGPRRPLESTTSRRRGAASTPRPRALLADARRRAARRGHAHRFRSGRRDQGRRRGALRRSDLPDDQLLAHRAPHDSRRSRRGAARLRRRARQPPPQARAARSSAPATASTCSPTTAPSAICSATGC